MEAAAQRKVWIAKTIGSAYFLLLGFIYFIVEMVSGLLTWGDGAVLLWTALPLLVSKRWLLLIFGGLNLMIWAYAGIAIIVKGVGEIVPLLLISGLTVASIVAALLLIYSAISISSKSFSLI